MGVYRAATVTVAGQNMIARALAGEGALRFVRAEASSCRYPPEADVAALPSLSEVRQSTEPFSAEVLGGTVVQVGVRFDNSEVAQAYLVETIGLYARVGDGGEGLFSVIQANVPDQMPAASPVSPSAFIYNIQTTVLQAGQLSVTVSPAGTATVQDVERLQKQIDLALGAMVAMSYDPEAESLAFSYAGGGIAPGTGASPYVLPVATATTLGGVRIGEGVAVDADGTISVDADGIAESAASLVEENAEEFSIDEISALFNQV